ncbi:MAG: DUF6268 family outer membrane beta-barrel protein [Bacteroidetes bacterium]|nr:DUF6268 family outer membrane beta-barrel protein [Bacteroidota bacterium]
MKIYFLSAIIYFVFSLPNRNSVAQEVAGLSFGYEYFPSTELVTPLVDAPGLEIETQTWSLSGAFPLSFQKGKIIVYNHINYKHISFSYDNLPISAVEISQAQYIEYSFFMIDSLSPKWKLVAMVMPTLASDFESSLSKDDLIVGGILGLIRTINENLDLGFGLVYMSDFGNPIPLPFIYVDWQLSPNLKLNGIIPSSLTLGRKMTEWLDLGLEFSVDGSRFHGSPAKFGVKRPFMRYSEGTLSALTQFHFAEWIHLNVLGGWGFYRNFEFYEGRDKQESFDMKMTGYFGTQFIIGI